MEPAGCAISIAPWVRGASDDAESSEGDAVSSSTWPVPRMTRTNGSSFEDEDEERTWVFDVTFLTSNWTCIFGNGCQGVLTGPAPELVQGCCSYGAHLVDKKDARRVREDRRHAHARRVAVPRHQEAAPREEQAWRDGDEAGRRSLHLPQPTGVPGWRRMRVPHRRPSSRGGPGDHEARGVLAAPLRREDHVDDDNGHVTSTVRQWDRRHWGKGGLEFHWWCTEAPDAFVGKRAVYRAMEVELTRMIGSKVYARLVAALRERDRLRGQQVALPHPAVRKRGRTNSAAASGSNS